VAVSGGVLVVCRVVLLFLSFGCVRDLFLFLQKQRNTALALVHAHATLTFTCRWPGVVHAHSQTAMERRVNPIRSLRRWPFVCLCVRVWIVGLFMSCVSACDLLSCARNKETQP